MGKHEPVAFQTAPSWVLVFPFSSAVRDKSLAQLRVRLEVLHRLLRAHDWAPAPDLVRKYAEAGHDAWLLSMYAAHSCLAVVIML